MTAVKILIDTNIIIYAHSNHPLEAGKRQIATSWLNQLEKEKRGYLTTQVLGEVSRQLLRILAADLKRAYPKLASEVQALLTDYMKRFQVILIEPQDIVEALRGVEKHSLSFWDALIWACAKSNDIDTILTEDGPSGAVIEGVRYLNPFLE